MKNKMKKKPLTETEAAIVACVFSFIIVMILFGSHNNFKLEKTYEKEIPSDTIDVVHK